MALFTSEHIDRQKQIHKDCPAYGAASLVFAPMVSELVNANTVSKLLDYGSGQGQLGHHLETEQSVEVHCYDPAFEQAADKPETTEMVACLDVLDNVEKDCIADVLDDLKRVTGKIGFFAISTQGSEDDDKSLSDKQYYPVEWWLPKLMERFELHYFSRINNGFVVVVRSLSIQ